MIDPAALQPRPCPRCGREGLTVLEGPDLEAICIACLEKVDPVRAAVLKKIAGQRGDQGLTP